MIHKLTVLANQIPSPSAPASPATTPPTKLPRDRNWWRIVAIVVLARVADVATTSIGISLHGVEHELNPVIAVLYSHSTELGTILFTGLSIAALAILVYFLAWLKQFTDTGSRIVLGLTAIIWSVIATGNTIVILTTAP